MADKASRAAQIKSRERAFGYLRKSVIPFCFTYGLFILRPKEYNFINYVSMRRRHDAEFNKMFPQPEKSEVIKSGLFARHAEFTNGADGTRDVIGSTTSRSLPATSELNAQMEGFLRCDGPVCLEFASYFLFGIGKIRFTSAFGDVKQLRFAGVLGSFWVEY